MAQIIPLARREAAMIESPSLGERVARLEVEVESVKKSVEGLDEKFNQLETTQGARHTENTNRLTSIQSTLDYQRGEAAANARTSAWIGRGITGAVSAALGAIVTYFIGHH